MNFSAALLFVNLLARPAMPPTGLCSATVTFSHSESDGVCFTGVGLRVSVSLSVTTIGLTKKSVYGFVPNFTGRFVGGKGRPSSCFVTIGRGMWK